MQEQIFDLQTDITNLIIGHGLENGEYAFIYREGKLMIMDLTQAPIKDAVAEKMQNNSQETEKEL